MLPPLSAVCGEVGIPCCDHASFTGCQDLARVKTEAGHRAERFANQAPLILRSNGTGSVFDDRQTMLLGNLQIFLHFSREANLMDDKDRLGPRGDRFFDLEWI